MTANLLTIVQIALSIAVLLVAIGRWGGKLEARRPTSIAPQPDEPKGNGQPTFGEIVRRVENLERDVKETYMRKDVAAEMSAESKRDREANRALILATQRRLDDLQGT